LHDGLLLQRRHKSYAKAAFQERNEETLSTEILAAENLLLNLTEKQIMR
jgi:hypothetical protein